MILTLELMSTTLLPDLLAGLQWRETHKVVWHVLRRELDDLNQGAVGVVVVFHSVNIFFEFHVSDTHSMQKDVP